jgi:hypothetical protein
VGWVPGDVASRPTAHQKIVLAMTNPQALFTDPPAALSVRGQLQAAGNALVDSRGDQSCGRKVGTMTTGDATLQGTPGIFGAMDGNETPNQLTSAHNGPIPPGAGDVVTSVAASAFDQYAWTDDDINALRAYAKSHGTYRQGAVRFDASNRMPDGVVFVDTLSGANVTREGVSPATPAADLAQVSIGSDAAANPGGRYHGWLFVNGSLSIAGSFAMRGLIYTQGDLAYHGIGTSGVSGAVISRNIRGLSTTSIDSDPMGAASITYDCHDARTGGGTIPASWTVKPGTYRELCDSCS